MQVGHHVSVPQVSLWVSQFVSRNQLNEDCVSVEVFAFCKLLNVCFVHWPEKWLLRLLVGYAVSALCPESSICLRVYQ